MVFFPVNEFKTYDYIFDELISVCGKSMALQGFVCIDATLDNVLQIEFVLFVDEKDEKKASNTFAEQLKKKNNVLFYMEMVEKGLY